MTMWLMTVLASVTPPMPPPQAPPGVQPTVDTLMSWLRWGVPIAAGLVILAGIIMWVAGSTQSDLKLTHYGKRATGTGVIAGMISPFLPTIVNQLFT